MAVPAAVAAVVCGWSPDQDPDCTASSIAEAVASGATDIEVRYEVLEFYAIPVDRPISVHGDPGSRVYTQVIGGSLFEVGAGGTGSTFSDLRIDGSDFPGDDGGFLDVSVARVSVVDTTLVQLDSKAPLLRVGDGGSLTLDQATITGSRLQATAPIVVDHATLTVTGGSITGNTASVDAISASASVVSVDGTTITTGTLSGTPTYAAFDLQDSVSTVTDALVTGPSPGLVAIGGSVTVSGGYWLGGTPYLAVISAYTADLLAVEGATLQSADGGTALFAETVAWVSVRDATFPGSYGFPSHGYTSTYGYSSTGYGTAGGAVSADRVARLSVRGSWFCGLAALDGAAIAASHSCGAGCVVSGSVFQSDLVQDGGAALLKFDQGTVDLERSTFAYDAAPGGSAIFVGPTASWSANRLLFVDTVGASLINAPPPTDLGFAAYLGDTPFGTFPLVDDDVRAVDSVVFTGSEAPCGIPMVPDPDVTDPFVLDHDLGAEPTCHTTETAGDGVDEDCDGSELCPVDADGDGFAGSEVASTPHGPRTIQPTAIPCPVVASGDCDDSDPDAFPGAPDPWYDGRDQDCAGNDDRDQDGDGVDRSTDCDDTDPGVTACAFSLAGGGCDTVGDPVGPRSVLGWGALVALWWKRHSAPRAAVGRRPEPDASRADLHAGSSRVGPRPPRIRTGVSGAGVGYIVVKRA